MIKGKFKALSTYTNEELAAWTLAGYTGYGDERKKFLGDRYYPVQKIVNSVLSNNIIPVGDKAVDSAALDKAVRETFNAAADTLIEEIQKEIRI